MGLMINAHLRSVMLPWLSCRSAFYDLGLIIEAFLFADREA